MLDDTKSVKAKRVATESGRYYGPFDIDIEKTTKNPLRPSWTNIASVESSPGLSEWKMVNGHWSKVIGYGSATIGTITHDAVDVMNRRAMNKQWGQTVKKIFEPNE